MKIRAIRVASVLAVAAGLGACAWGQAPAQDSKPAAQTPCSAADAAAQKCTPAPPKSTADRFPFPGEDTSTPPTRPADWGPDTPIPPDPADAAKKAAGGPDAPSGAAKKPSVPQAYPGDPDAPKAGDDGFSSSSSSSSSNGSPDGPPDDPGGLTDAGSSGDTTSSKVPIYHRKKLAKVATPETPESRAAEDLTVADFYQNDGNFKGAYERAKDAVQNQPNDPYTHFALAEAARKLGKVDEAKAEYAAVLKLDPIPKQEKASQRALAELASK